MLLFEFYWIRFFFLIADNAWNFMEPSSTELLRVPAVLYRDTSITRNRNKPVCNNGELVAITMIYQPAVAGEEFDMLCYHDVLYPTILSLDVIQGDS
jgi:hypothetical protein